MRKRFGRHQRIRTRAGRHRRGHPIQGLRTDSWECPTRREQKWGSQIDGPCPQMGQKRMTGRQWWMRDVPTYRPIARGTSGPHLAVPQPTGAYTHPGRGETVRSHVCHLVS
jgi:hypothetical protein